MSKDFAGLNGFIWWMGVVEDRQDPLKLGRCRVRIVGWHSPNKSELPTKSLPWSQQMTPLNNTNPYAPKEGDMVIGFFIDGDNAQEPVMMGVLPGIPLSAANPQQGFNDPRSAAQLKNAPVKPGETATNYPRVLDEPTTSRLARNDTDSIDKTIVETKKKNKVGPFELDTTYATKYPYNNVYESESGHVMEFDDTPKKERVHLYHREGSYIELQADGSGAFKIVKNKNDTIGGNYSLYVKGNMKVIVDGNISFESNKNISFKAADSFSVSASSISLNASQTFSAKGLSASLTGQVSTSLGGMLSQTKVSGLITKISGKAITEVSGTGVLNMSGGITNINGGLINLIGVPIGGDVGADIDVADAATDAVDIEFSDDLFGGLDDITADFGGIDIDPGALTDQLSDVATNVSDAVSSSLDTISNNLDNFDVNFDEFGDLDAAIAANQDLVGNIVDNAAAAAESMIDNVKEQLGSISDNISDKLQGSVDSITGPLKENLTSLEGNFDVLSSDTSSLKEKLAAAQSIVSTGTELVQRAQDIPAQAAATVTGLIKTTTDDVSGRISGSVKNTEIVQTIKDNLSTTYDGYVDLIKENADSLTDNLGKNANKVVDEWVFQNKDDVIDKVSGSALEVRLNGGSLDDVKATIADGIQTSWRDYYAVNQAKVAPLTNRAIQDSGELTENIGGGV